MVETIELGNVRLLNFEQLYEMITLETRKYNYEQICVMVDVLLKIIRWASPRYKLSFDNIVIHGMMGERINQNNEIERFTWWPTTMTLRTYLKHPKKGCNELERGSLGEDFTLNQIKKVLTEATGQGKGLRAHLGTGYRKKASKKNTKPKGDCSE